MSPPKVVAVAPGSPAARAGVAVGDEVVSLNGQVPRDVIQWRLLADDADVELEVHRGGRSIPVTVTKRDGEALGAEVSSALFDRVRTCDNHCAFCFIYQLPAGMRRSLYLKDDDYRLSFLYGNFTTLTRFTEADLERVLIEGLSPLNVSIHATDPDVRAAMLRNRRGGTSLRWLRALLEHGVTVHGQVVVCPGVNDGAVLEDTLAGVLDEYPELASLCLVPLGVSRYNTEAEMRPHTTAEANAVVDAAAEWQEIFHRALGRRVVHAADEYFLLADRPFPALDAYDDLSQHENGVGMATQFAREVRAELTGDDVATHGTRTGFFAWVDGAPAEGYRAPRLNTAVQFRVRDADPAPITILTGEYGARVLAPVADDLAAAAHAPLRVVPVENRFFGGNIAVTGLLTGPDVARVLDAAPDGVRFLLPDVVLSNGRFLDGTTPADLPRPVEIVPTDGASLVRAVRS